MQSSEATDLVAEEEAVKLETSPNFLVRITKPIEVISSISIVVALLLLTYIVILQIFPDIDIYRFSNFTINSIYIYLLFVLVILGFIFILQIFTLIQPLIEEAETLVKDDKSTIRHIFVSKTIEKGKDSEIEINVVNNLTPFGMKIVFSSFSQISPKVHKLFIENGKKVSTFLSVFPFAAGSETINVTFYPIFNEKGEEIPYADPLFSTSFKFVTQASTFLGITGKQFSKMKKNLGLSLLFLTIFLSGITIFGSVQEIEILLATIAPVFLVLQVPIIFIYYTLRNRLLDLAQLRLK
jgi:hypothetical protein